MFPGSPPAAGAFFPSTFAAGGFIMWSVWRGPSRMAQPASLEEDRRR
jgi:hypothetical protein